MASFKAFMLRQLREFTTIITEASTPALTMVFTPFQELQTRQAQRECFVTIRQSYATARWRRLWSSAAIRKDLTMNMPETRGCGDPSSERRSPPSRISILVRRTICPERGLVSVGVNAVREGRQRSSPVGRRGQTCSRERLTHTYTHTQEEAADNELLHNAEHPTTQTLHNYRLKANSEDYNLENLHPPVCLAFS